MAGLVAKVLSGGGGRRGRQEPPRFKEGYLLHEVLGKGAYSKVMRGTNKQTGEAVAVKCIKRSGCQEKEILAIKSEAEILRSISHPNIVGLLGFWEEKTHFYVVLELCSGGELFDRIVKKTSYSELEARKTLGVLLEAVNYIHKQDIVHRDLKPENLLLASEDNDWNVKLADFGFASKFKDADGLPTSLKTQCGTPGYVAPEILRHVPYDAPCDMWSIGVILYIVLGGYPPFHDENQARLFMKIKKGRFAFHKEYWSSISAEAKDLISAMLQVDPDKRITAEQALRHPWLCTEGNTEQLAQPIGSIQRLQVFNARRKFKSAINSVVVAQRLQRFLLGRDINTEYRFGPILGRGAHSVVKQATHMETGEEVAIKVINRSGLGERDESALKREIRIMLQLRHRNIIKLIDFYEEPNSFFLVVEKVNGGELFDRIVRKTFYREKEARDLVKTLLKAVDYCHSCGVVHRDLKPENILLVGESDDSDIKVADFGFAEHFGGSGLKTQCGTPGYVAPEVLKGLPYDKSVDMWSIGVIMYILLGGYPPFHDENQGRLFMKIKKGVYVFHEEYWKNISAEAKDLVSLMLVVDPERRISAAQALSHPYLSVSDDTLMEHDMQDNLQNMAIFNAKVKFRSAIRTVLAVQGFARLSVERMDRSSNSLISQSASSVHSADSGPPTTAQSLGEAPSEVPSLIQDMSIEQMAAERQGRPHHKRQAAS